MNKKTISLFETSNLNKTSLSKSWFLVTVVSLFLLITTAAGLHAQSSQTAERSRWFREARVGMIIHWGLYSIPAGEWNGKQIPWYGEWIKDRGSISNADYTKLASGFNPQKFNADEWIKTANDAGMKYFCLVTKHHDGFALWDTKENSNWNVMDATPFKRDIVKELSDACHKQGMVYSLYYSSGLDWHYPSADWANYKPYYYRQLKELLTNYGKIGYLWFDGEWTAQWNEKEATDLYNYVLSIDPNIITNNPKKKSSAAYGDFGLDEENYTPSGDTWYRTGLWERDRLVQENTWGYKTWEPWKKSIDLIRDMIDAASKSMNFCVNVGPKADGTFPAEANAILQDFGTWLKVNGNSIYKTTGFVKDISLDFSGKLTQSISKDSTWYVHVLDWPQNASTIKITTTLPISSVAPLDPTISLGKPTMVTANGKTVISISKPTYLDPFATVIKLTVKSTEVTNLVQTIELNPKSLNIAGSGSSLITATIFPDNASNKVINWTSSDREIASVSGRLTAIVKGVSPGNCKIYAVTSDGSKTDSCVVFITALPVSGLKLDMDATSVKIDKAIQLNASIEPVSATDKSIVWSSSNENIAKVTDGLVAGISEGKVSIIAKSVSSDFADTCIVDILTNNQEPYLNVLRTIPGKIQVEDFDEGGEGIAYHDVDPTNRGGAYRMGEGVDIEGNFNIGYVQNGEWLEYTVDVTPGRYAFQLNMATPYSGTVQVSLNGRKLCDFQVIPTGDWGKYAINNSDSIDITESGKKRLRLEMQTTDPWLVNIDWFAFGNSKTTGILSGNLTKNEIEVFPNPTSQVLNIKFNKGSEKKVGLSITNLLSQKVIESVVTATSGTLYAMNVSSLEKGFYILNIQTGSELYSKEIIIR